MKQKLILLFFLAFVCKGLMAQVPQGIPYQSVIRNSSGTLVANQTVKMRFSIHDSITSGTVVYQETFSTTTSSLGLANVNIGMGTIVSGTFSGINWGKNSKFIQVEMDPTGGTNYTDMGTTQMMSVPYALFCANGTPGPQGLAGNNGTNGQNTLVNTYIEAAGSNCATGGVKLEYGLDANSNGILEVGEINAALTKYVCNGATGAQGVQGATGAAGFMNMQVFNSSGSFTIPIGVTKIMVEAWGGGGGAWGSGLGGGGGGYGKDIFTVIPGTTYLVTIGIGGSKLPPPATSGASSGGTTSFGSLISATGGSGGGDWGAPGAVAGGWSSAAININGGNGTYMSGPYGGSSPLGGSSNVAPGGGYGSDPSLPNNYGYTNGAPGRIIVWW